MNGCGRYQCGGEYSVYFEMEMEGGGEGVLINPLPTISEQL